MANTQITPYIGVGLRAPHYREILKSRPSNIGWLEVHPENYFFGGERVGFLEELRKDYPVSFHGLGLSLGSAHPVSQQHLRMLKHLCDRFDPFLFSDHASWSASGNAHLNDLLPLPYTNETLARIKENVQTTQDFLQRTILVENPSSYLGFDCNDMNEPAFLNQLCDQTGCHLLLDVNNIYVQSVNHQFDPYAYVDEIKLDRVKEIHLAGHVRKKFDDGFLLVDTHSRHVCDEVWKLYEYTLRKLKVCHTLLEWDADHPSFKELIDEANLAGKIMKKVVQDAA